jgi:hypothetical protein
MVGVLRKGMKVRANRRPGVYPGLCAVIFKKVG